MPGFEWEDFVESLEQPARPEGTRYQFGFTSYVPPAVDLNEIMAWFKSEDLQAIGGARMGAVTDYLLDPTPHGPGWRSGWDLGHMDDHRVTWFCSYSQWKWMQEHGYFARFDERPTEAELREKLRERNVLTCTCRGVETERGRALIFDPSCPVHQSPQARQIRVEEREKSR